MDKENFKLSEVSVLKMQLVEERLASARMALSIAESNYKSFQAEMIQLVTENDKYEIAGTLDVSKGTIPRILKAKKEE